MTKNWRLSIYLCKFDYRHLNSPFKFDHKMSHSLTPILNWHSPSSQLFARNLLLFTAIRKDMKNHLLELEDKTMLRKRSLIESVFNVLKYNMNLEHSRHRSVC